MLAVKNNTRAILQSWSSETLKPQKKHSSAPYSKETTVTVTAHPQSLMVVFHPQHTHILEKQGKPKSRHQKRSDGNLPHKKHQLLLKFTIIISHGTRTSLDESNLAAACKKV